jgi:drug/metabolite transporter (DMT)-like permease
MKDLLKNKRSLALLCLLASAIGYAVLGANSRILEKGFQPMTQVYVRIALGMLISLIVFNKKLRIKSFITTPKKDIFWLLVMGVIGYAVGVWMITQASLNAKLVNVAIIYATIPFIVYIYSYFLLKEKIRGKLIILLIFSLYGIAVVSSKSLIPNISGFGIGELFALFSVLASGWWSIGIKKLSGHLNTQEISVAVMFIAASSGLVIALLQGEPLNLQSFTIPEIIIGLIIGAGLNSLLSFSENFAFKHINAVLGNQILMTTTFFSLIIGFIFYQENISAIEFLGGAIIFVSVWFANKLLAKE